ncbi:MAG: NAD-dependent epimerase/dehydratase family protein [Gammaproteobacteria bacterium]|nr:NAD-dependent epimerase/dehydratase family protein [Gammaproteobacteria bacterium]MDH4314451.1 NAD-dependent epimerase/dehydratase family protein [Gammaproteobacteria bacterium]MDH5213300.1 NAD-dependent epimerase/dehydratase family protein [Gammaproteobacteria bacterium]MDH5499827.1 NAD-dependent epimerase/dehydratase family protein [Gammaproteobacteria bacterium]
MQIAVIGAGYVGGRVLEGLGPGKAVAYGRSPSSGHAVQSLDLDHGPCAIASMPEKIFYTVPPDPQAGSDPRLAALLATLDPAPERFVYLSTSGVYGDCKGELVRESRQPAPVTPRAIRRHAAEKMLQDWCSKFATRCIIFRVPGIYGPGRLGVERIAAGEAYIREKDANPGNRIHADDLAAASIAALERNIPEGIYNVCDGDYRSATWFALTVAKLAGLSPPPLISRSEALASMSQLRLSFLAESRRLDTQKMREVLRFEPRYTNAEDGIRASLLADDLLRGQRTT